MLEKCGSGVQRSMTSKELGGRPEHSLASMVECKVMEVMGGAKL